MQQTGIDSPCGVLPQRESISGHCAKIGSRPPMDAIDAASSLPDDIELQDPFRLVFNSELTSDFMSIIDNFTNIIEYESADGLLLFARHSDRMIALEAIRSHWKTPLVRSQDHESCMHSSSRSASPSESKETDTASLLSDATNIVVETKWETVTGRKRGRRSHDSSPSARSSPSPDHEAKNTDEMDTSSRSVRIPRPSKKLILRPVNPETSNAVTNVRHILDSFTNLIRYNVLKGSRGDIIVTFCSPNAVLIAKEAFLGHGTNLFEIIPQKASSSSSWTTTKTSWQIKISPTPKDLDCQALCDELKADTFWVLSRSKDLVLSFGSREAAAKLINDGILFGDLYLRAVPYTSTPKDFRIPRAQCKICLIEHAGQCVSPPLCKCGSSSHITAVCPKLRAAVDRKRKSYRAALLGTQDSHVLTRLSIPEPLSQALNLSVPVVPKAMVPRTSTSKLIEHIQSLETRLTAIENRPPPPSIEELTASIARAIQDHLSNIVPQLVFSTLERHG